MIVHKTGNHQVTEEFKHLQVPLWLSTMNEIPNHMEAVKGHEMQIVKLYMLCVHFKE